jgi:hypothetical protein
VPESHRLGRGGAPVGFPGPWRVIPGGLSRNRGVDFEIAIVPWPFPDPVIDWTLVFGGAFREGVMGRSSGR